MRLHKRTTTRRAISVDYDDASLRATLDSCLGGKLDTAIQVRMLGGMAAVFLGMAFLLPIAESSVGARISQASGYALARGPAPHLWNIPLCALILASTVYRRRSIRDLLRARVAILMLACMPLLSAAYAWSGMLRGGRQLAQTLQCSASLQPLSGAWCLVASTLSTLLATLVLRKSAP